MKEEMNPRNKETNEETRNKVTNKGMKYRSKRKDKTNRQRKELTKVLGNEKTTK